MKRHLFVTVLLAVVLLPDWSSACWVWWGRPAYSRTYAAPRWSGPVYYAARPPTYPPAYAPPVVCAPVYAPPTYHEYSYVQPASTPAVAGASAPLQSPRVFAENGGGTRTDPPPRPAQPAAAALDPAPAPDAPKLRPVNAATPESAPPAAPPKAEPTGPRLDFPTGPAPSPAGDSPKPGAEVKPPPLELPGAAAAVPAPAPAPDTLIPAAGVPALKNPDALPPLTLPPDAPVAPDSSRSTEVKSSPLSGRDLRVTVFPATGGAAAAGLRKVGFYNHTTRDLALTVEGRTVALPAKTYLHAQLPPTFTWTCAGRPAARETVPADAVGVDVLIKE